MAAGPGVNITAKGLTDLQAGLRDSQKALGREQRRANKEVAEKVAGWSRSAASTRAERRFAPAIRGRSTQRVARIAVSSRGGMGGAAATFFGARPLTRHGWNAGRKRGPQQKPQYPAWVGNTWIGGRAGEGPYVINPTIARRMPDIEELYLDAHQRAVRRAFPEGGSFL